MSLERVVKRVLIQWDALYAYFDRESEEDNSARVTRLNGHFNSDIMKLVLLFLEYALDCLCKFNAAFQSDLPMLPRLQDEVTRLLKLFLARFIKTEVIRSVGEEITTLNISDPELQLPNMELGIGHKTWAFISKKEDSIDTSVKDHFFSGVRKFYEAVTSTMIKKFSFSDHVLNDLTILLPESQANNTLFASTVLCLAGRFTPAVPEEEINNLEEEVLDYVLSNSVSNFVSIGTKWVN